jgi:SAM-dependent methyltransferase
MRHNHPSKTTAPHEWLGRRIDETEYLAPMYYARLLKPYATGGRSDLAQLEEFLKRLDSAPRLILELGCGSGRATSVPLSLWPSMTLTACDLSASMLAALPKDSRLRPVQSDICEFLMHRETCRSYDLIFSLWAFSHSIHLWLGREHAGTAPVGYTKTAIASMLTDCLVLGGSFFIIHFDSLSSEQRIAMPQWAKVNPIFADTDTQSPSFRLLTAVLEELRRQGRLDADIVHCVGNPIVYTDVDEAMETYFNFHLEGRLNTLPVSRRDHAVAEVQDALMQNSGPDGRIVVEPAWFVISGRRTDG